MKNFRNNLIIISAVLSVLPLFMLLTSVNIKLLRSSSKSAFEKISKTKIDTSFGVDNITLPIFTFHYVEIVKNKTDFIRKSLSITPLSFENDLRRLKSEGYTFYFVKDIPGIFNGSIKLGNKSIVFTFDDGYEDFYTDVFPIIKKYNVKVTIYVVYNFIGKPNYMNKAQIQEVINSGLVELGSHSMNHLNLISILPQRYSHEIQTSKKELQKLFGTTVYTFAYPYGFYNSQLINEVKNSGYTAAVGTSESKLQSRDTLFNLGRFKSGGFEHIIR